MSDVKVPYGDKPSDTATLLLAAAEEKGLEASVVRTDSFGRAFIVPDEVADAAGVDTLEEPKATEESTSGEDEGDEKPKAAKRAAKKTTASKES